MENFQIILIVVVVYVVGTIIYLAIKQKKESSIEYIVKQYEKELANDSDFFQYNPPTTSSRQDSSKKQDERRCLDGNPLVTDNDWKQWWIWKGYADALSRYLSKLESQMTEMDNLNSAATLSKWQQIYAKVRNIYQRHGMWNLQIDDGLPFIPTAIQLSSERAYIDRIQKAQKNALPDQLAYKEYSEKILQYIMSQPRHVARKSALLTAVSNGSADTRKIVMRVYRRMCRNKTIREKQNETGHWEVKKAYTRKKQTVPEDNRVSVFSPELYRSVSVSTEYKALITVGAPVSLSESKGSCKFSSTSSDNVYTTHLDHCTCPMYCKGEEPCKHMVALAAKLGYYKMRVQKSVPKS